MDKSLKDDLDNYIELCSELLYDKKKMNGYIKRCSKIILPYIDVRKWEESIYLLYK